MKRQAASFGLALLLTGCAQLSKPTDPKTTPPPVEYAPLKLSSSNFSTAYTLVPGVHPIAVGAITTAMINAFIDNWSLEHTPIGKDKYRIVMRKKVLSSGGDGEAAQLFKFRAEQIVGTIGYDSYHIVEYNEGLETGTFGAQRVAQGVIQCSKTSPYDNR